MLASRPVRNIHVALLALTAACGGGGDATGPEITRVVLTPSSLTLTGVGATGLLAAHAIDALGTPVTDATVAWSSDNPAVATVERTGSSATVTAVTNGITSIRATIAGITEAATITVNARVLRVTVSPGNLTLRVGESGPLDAVVDADPGVPMTYVWESSAALVATVSATGQVTAIGKGSATITARSTADPTKSAAALVTVLGVSNVAVSPQPVTLDRGATQQMSATVVADAGISTAVSWRSTNASAVSVSPAGEVRALDPGSAWIVATSLAQPGTGDSARVTVRDGCASPYAYMLGTTVNGSLTMADCARGRTDYYDYSLAQATRFSLTVSPTSKRLNLYPLVSEVGWGWSVFPSPATTIYVLASAGTHRLAVFATDTTDRDSYVLTTSVMSSVPPDCPSVISTTAVSASLALTSTCPGYLPSGLAGSFRSQRFMITLAAGKTLRVTVVAPTYQARIELKDPLNTSVLASAFAPAAGAPAVLVFTPSVNNSTYLFVTSQTSGAVGSYTITIDP